MREVSEDEYRRTSTDSLHAFADWKASPAEVLKTIDEQLRHYGLEIVLLDEDADQFEWKIAQLQQYRFSP